ncbi:hypothetical protein AC482_05035 [miscellaneous Crenarchaeota group-15 archaeon DG-45]|uniref:HAD family hydrolase n=1 Tax=miscellaneous Crenarchaeota group-15 archaeon DG-45 TaxID=1685127 RepID=A0A0M0BN99_9ARCH|nr:MAG: hypothetical protein AC482_05035 [miscellaneous Crenarchaeota group-15 archaeon DG-45]
MMPEGYLTLELDEGRAYVREGSLEQLGTVDAIVFDCDGVLIDVRDSYDRAISRSTSHIFEALTGLPLPEEAISGEVIYLFRRSGGFNDDWDTVYGILMFLLCDLPETLRSEIARRVEGIEPQMGPFERVASVGDAPAGIGDEGWGEEFLEGSMGRLRDFAELLDETGVESVDRSLAGAFGTTGERRGFLRALKGFLRHPEGVGEGVISTVFEELFCGSGLFAETHGAEPRFHEGPGLIEMERPILRAETLDRLIPLMGGANFGVASGSRLAPARFILGDLLDRFHPGALIFLDDVERAERKHSEDAGARVNLKKPNPFSLLTSAEAIQPRGAVLYVGDSMADAMTAREANRAVARFSFAGVYGHSQLEDVLRRDLIEAGCDAVLPSVNEIPAVLEWLRKAGAEGR